MKDQILVPESRLRETEAQVARMAATIDPPTFVDWSNPTYAPAFLYFMLFYRWPFLLGDATPASDELRFYNEYFWFSKFSQLYCKLNGSNVGLEDFGSKLLGTASGDIDWEIVEEIDGLFHTDDA